MFGRYVLRLYYRSLHKIRRLLGETLEGFLYTQIRGELGCQGNPRNHAAIQAVPNL